MPFQQQLSPVQYDPQQSAAATQKVTGFVDSAIQLLDKVGDLTLHGAESLLVKNLEKEVEEEKAKGLAEDEEATSILNKYNIWAGAKTAHEESEKGLSEGNRKVIDAIGADIDAGLRGNVLNPSVGSKARLTSLLNKYIATYPTLKPQIERMFQMKAGEIGFGSKGGSGGGGITSEKEAELAGNLKAIEQITAEGTALGFDMASSEGRRLYHIHRQNELVTQIEMKNLSLKKAQGEVAAEEFSAIEMKFQRGLVEGLKAAVRNPSVNGNEALLQLSFSDNIMRYRDGLLAAANTRYNGNIPSAVLKKIEETADASKLLSKLGFPDVKTFLNADIEQKERALKSMEVVAKLEAPVIVKLQALLGQEYLRVVGTMAEVYNKSAQEIQDKMEVLRQEGSVASMEELARYQTALAHPDLMPKLFGEIANAVASAKNIEAEGGYTTDMVTLGGTLAVLPPEQKGSIAEGIRLLIEADNSAPTSEEGKVDPKDLADTLDKIPAEIVQNATEGTGFPETEVGKQYLTKRVKADINTVRNLILPFIAGGEGAIQLENMPVYVQDGVLKIDYSVPGAREAFPNKNAVDAVNKGIGLFLRDDKVIKAITNNEDLGGLEGVELRTRVLKGILFDSLLTAEAAATISPEERKEAISKIRSAPIRKVGTIEEALYLTGALHPFKGLTWVAGNITEGLKKVPVVGDAIKATGEVISTATKPVVEELQKMDRGASAALEKAEKAAVPYGKEIVAGGKALVKDVRKVVGVPDITPIEYNMEDLDMNRVEDRVFSELLEREGASGDRTGVAETGTLGLTVDTKKRYQKLLGKGATDIEIIKKYLADLRGKFPPALEKAPMSLQEAVLDTAYNAGEKALGWTNLNARLNEGNWIGAAKELLDSANVNGGYGSIGLARRRAIQYNKVAETEGYPLITSVMLLDGKFIYQNALEGEIFSYKPNKGIHRSSVSKFLLVR